MWLVLGGQNVDVLGATLLDRKALQELLGEDVVLGVQEAKPAQV